MRFLCIGCGSIGKRHISNLRQLGVDDIIATDAREDRRREVAERFGVPVFADLSSALGQDVQVALICTPTSLHLEHALMAARAGCHLLIEKPVSDTLDGVDKLLEEVQRRRLVTLVGCNLRFHPGVRHVKALLEKEAIGKVTSARAQYGQYLPDWHPWEDYRKGYSARRVLGGGVILDRIHEIDYMRWLLGDITEVSAMMGHLSNLDIDTEDTVEVLLRFASGVLGSLHLDYVRRTYDSSLEIVGEAGTIQWCYQDEAVRWYLADDGKWNILLWPGYDDNEMYLAEMRHFLGALRGEERSEEEVAHGIRNLSIALAAKQAAVEQRTIRV